MGLWQGVSGLWRPQKRRPTHRPQRPRNAEERREAEVNKLKMNYLRRNPAAQEAYVLKLLGVEDPHDPLVKARRDAELAQRMVEAAGYQAAAKALVDDPQFAKQMAAQLMGAKTRSGSAFGELHEAIETIDMLRSRFGGDAEEREKSGFERTLEMLAPMMPALMVAITARSNPEAAQAMAQQITGGGAAPMRPLPPAPPMQYPAAGGAAGMQPPPLPQPNPGTPMPHTASPPAPVPVDAPPASVPRIVTPEALSGLLHLPASTAAEAFWALVCDAQDQLGEDSEEAIVATQVLQFLLQPIPSLDLYSFFAPQLEQYPAWAPLVSALRDRPEWIEEVRATLRRFETEMQEQAAGDDKDKDKNKQPEPPGSAGGAAGAGPSDGAPVVHANGTPPTPAILTVP